MNATSEQGTAGDMPPMVYITVQLFELNSTKHEILDLPMLTKSNAFVVLSPAVSRIVPLLSSLNNDDF